MYKTAREVYIDVLTEMLKEEAPTVYLEDFNYYFNKAVSEYLKLRYELFEATQQLTDDLRFWKEEYPATALEIPIDDIGLPDGKDYRHLTSCVFNVTLTRPVTNCEQQALTTKTYRAVRMSSSVKAGLHNNVYLEPTFYRPYFDIINNKIRIFTGSSLPSWVKISNIVVEYLRHPAIVDLTEAQVANDPDTSQVMEFTSDVGDEIVKILMKLLLERGMNPRLQTQIPVNQSINDPAIRGQQ